MECGIKVPGHEDALSKPPLENVSVTIIFNKQKVLVPNLGVRLEEDMLTTIAVLLQIRRLEQATECVKLRTSRFDAE